MSRIRTPWKLGLLVGALAVAGTLAEEGDNKPYLKLSGFYAFNGYSQNNFFLGSQEGGAGPLSDKDEYAIQLVRLTTEFGFGEHVKAIVRADVGQGIFGIDNSREDGSTPGFSELFNAKDTNFETHIDHAYLDATHPGWNTNFKLGRMKYSIGNLLVLDQDGDGFLITRSYDGQKRSRLGWIKMFEGADSLSDEAVVGGANLGNRSTEDADLWLADYRFGNDKWTVTPFLAHYTDDGWEDGSAYLINELQYNRPRFTPQITEATAIGASFTCNLESWAFKGEVDYLTGDDEIANATAGAAQRLDVNDGDLDGYNLYVDAKTDLGPGKLGFVLGMGSGDDDPMSGDGNINKIRTNGFFYVTEIWEDSVMPDEEGITPQGLGSPGSRGYREFENTTLFQVNYGWKASEKVNVFLSASTMQATEDVFAWADVVDTNSNGEIDPADDFSNVARDSDLGQEVDFRVSWDVLPGLTWTLRGGAFFPGDAAGYLINGTNTYDDTAWELRTTVRFNFGGIKLGG